MNKVILATLIAGVLASSCHNNMNNNANNQTQAGTDSTNKSDDAQFLSKVAFINLEEIKLGQLAEQRGTTQEVRDLGKMMVDDHTAAQSNLTQLAQKLSVTIPTTPNTDADDKYNDLNKESGTDFDKKYCDMMVDGHKDAISMFEKDSSKTTSNDVRQFTISTLPTLRKHLDHSKMCKEDSKS